MAFVPNYDQCPAHAHAAPLVRQLSPRAGAGGGGAVHWHVDIPGPGGTAVHQQINVGFTEGPPWDPIDPVRERFSFKR
jgi:hypothetical protein